MAATNTKGFPAYMKVIDVSVQDKDATLSLVDEKHTRITEASVRTRSVNAEDYSGVVQQKLEEEKKKAIDEKAELIAKNEALEKELAEFRAAKQAAEIKPEDPSTPPVVPPADDKKAPKGNK